MGTRKRAALAETRARAPFLTLATRYPAPPSFPPNPRPNPPHLADPPCSPQDPTTPTGLRVVFPEDSVPQDRSGNGFTTAPWSRLDGFSTSTTMITYLANASVELTPGLPGWQDTAASLAADCPTLLIDAVTGEHLPHFAELDYTSGEDAVEKAFMIWPTKQLEFSHRYIVAIRNVRNGANVVIPPSDGFRALRDGAPSSDPSIEERRALYADIFAILAATGVARTDLQIAWDFTTGSLEYTTGWMTYIRDDATARMPAEGPPYEILSVQDEYNGAYVERGERNI